MHDIRHDIEKLPESTESEVMEATDLEIALKK